MPDADFRRRDRPLGQNAKQSGNTWVPYFREYATLKRPTPAEGFDRRYNLHFAAGGGFDVREGAGLG